MEMDESCGSETTALFLFLFYMFVCFFPTSPKSNSGGVQAGVGTHQALALLAVLHPRVPAAVGQQAVLV